MISHIFSIPEFSDITKARLYFAGTCGCVAHLIAVAAQVSFISSTIFMLPNIHALMIASMALTCCVTVLTVAALPSIAKSYMNSCMYYYNRSQPPPPNHLANMKVYKVEDFDEFTAIPVTKNKMEADID